MFSCYLEGDPVNGLALVFVRFVYPALPVSEGLLADGALEDHAAAELGIVAELHFCDKFLEWMFVNHILIIFALIFTTQR